MSLILCYVWTTIKIVIGFNIMLFYGWYRGLVVQVIQSTQPYRLTVSQSVGEFAVIDCGFLSYELSYYDRFLPNFQMNVVAIFTLENKDARKISLKCWYPIIRLLGVAIKDKGKSNVLFHDRRNSSLRTLMASILLSWEQFPWIFTTSTTLLNCYVLLSPKHTFFRF